MKKTIVLMSSILIALFGVFLAAHDAFAVDPPHNGQNTQDMTMSCTTCHYDTTGPTPSWATQPTTTDETFYNNLCTSCHKPTTMTDSRYVVKTHSSQNISGKYGVWTVECRVCHNPHYQDQVSQYPTDPTANLFTGTIAAGNPVWLPSYTESTILVNAAGLTPNAWIDYMLVPDVLYPTKMYRIKSNTANSFTVIGAINGRYALVNHTFAVRLGSLVMGQLRTPSGVTTTVKFFTNMVGQPNSYASSTSITNVTGICQVCHQQTHSFNSANSNSLQAGPQHPVVGAGPGLCTSCHIHNEGFKGECNSCHGYPPSSNATLITKDRNNNPVVSDSGSGAGAHLVHVNTVNLDCWSCHNDGMKAGAGVGDDRINIKFNTALSGTLGSYDGKSPRTYYPYTGATGGNTYRCSNIYCHSSGQGTTSNAATPVYAQPRWNVPADGQCGGCHGITNLTLTSGNHAQHLTGYATTFVGCGDCHAGAANDASSYVSTNHLDKSIDVANGYTAAGAAGNGYGTCNAAACHGGGTPVWGMNTTGLDKCTVCHGTPTAGALGSSGAKMAPPLDTAQSASSTKVGAHQAHLTTNAISRALRCNECHIVPTNITDAGHIKDGTPGVAEVTFASSTIASANSASPTYSAGTCLTVYCHGSNMPKSTSSGADTSPLWSDTGYITGTASHDCGQCHGYPPTAISAHLTGTGLPLGPNTCASCHQHTNALGTGFTSSVVHLHVNGVLEVSGCNACHGQSGSTGAPLIASDLLSLPSYTPTGHGVGMHPKHVVTLNYTCNTCHAGNTMPSLDSVITMSFAGLGTGGTYTGTALNAPYSYNAGVQVGAAQTCSNLYCHGSSMAPNGGTDTSPNWTNATTGACGACHGASAANPPTRGSHSIHASSFTNAGYQQACTLCHVNYASQHVDGLSQVAFNTGDSRVSAGTTYSGTTTMLDAYSSCATLYCHSQGTSLTTPFTTPNVIPTWGATLDCAACHGNSASSSKLLTSNAHSFHLNDSVKNRAGRSFQCRECHSATASSTSDWQLAAGGTAYHVNQSVNIKFYNAGGLNRDTDNGTGPAYEGLATTAAQGASVTTGLGNNTCSNVYCHSVGNIDFTSKNVIAAGGVSFRTPTWSTVGGLDCDNCHGDGAGKAYPVYASGGSGTENSHPKHIESAGHTCNVCHVATTASTTISVATMTLVPGGSHLNRVEDVVFATMATKTGSYNGANKTCSTTYCHGTGPSVAWGGTTNCGSCHTANNTLPGKHAMHYGVSTTALNFGAASSPSGTFYVFNCGVCHPNNAHATGPASTIQTANVVFDAAIAGGGVYTAAGSLAGTDGSGYNWTAGSCAMYCHSRGTSATSPYPAPVVTNFNWNTASLDCAGCHGNSVGSTSQMATNAHNSHINDAAKSKIGRNFQCRECHSATASTTTDWATSSAQYHVDKKVNIKFYNAGGLNLDAENPAYQGVLTTVAGGASVTTQLGSNQCSNVYCHSLGNMDFTTKNIITVGAYSYATPTWGGAALTCDACHGDKAGKAYPVYASGGGGTENSHVAHVATNGYSCNLCHVTTTVSTTITAGSMTIVAGGTHLNRVEDVAFASYWTKTGVYNGANKTCSATYCHGSGTPQWGNAAAVTCGSCHLGSSDANDFTYNNGSLAVISQMEWTTSGHGRSTANGPYSVTNNTAANLPTAAGTGDACLYCHNDATGHGDAVNFFRLRSFASGTNGNQVCWNCHGTGSVGVNPKSGTSATVNGVTKVDKYHYGGQHAATLSAGQFCWDCHEPHGDRASGALGPIAMIQSRPALSSDPVTGKPVSVVATTVTFTSNNSGASYGAASAPYDKICNVCHTYNPVGQQKMVHYTTSTSDGHNQAQVCTSCHKHSGNTSKDGEAFKGGACDGCHGYPPKGGDLTPYMMVNGVSVTVFEGKGGWATGPTFSGGHKAHVDHLVSLSGFTLDAANDTFTSPKLAFLCGACHDMNIGNHTTDGNGTRNINFNSGQTYSFGTIIPTYNGVPGVPSSVKPKTCSNVSCHFQDAPRWQDPAINN